MLIELNDNPTWEKLEELCSDARVHSEYYPAWNYCLDYATTNGLTGELAQGWHLPAYIEIADITNKIVNESLIKAGGRPQNYVYDMFWTSKQYTDSYGDIAGNKKCARVYSYPWGGVHGKAAEAWVYSVRYFEW